MVIQMGSKALFSWSGGKDSALALYEVLGSRSYDIASLLTTVTEGYDRVSMHGVRLSLLEMQADSLGLALEKVIIPRKASNEEYEISLEKSLLKYKGSGVESVIYGDIFLEEIRKYREEQLGRLGLGCVFPIWGRDSFLLARTFIEAGFKAVAVCVDSTLLDGGFAGREFDYDFLSELPPGIDPCGENGEFHTFVYDGPAFRERVVFEKGEIVLRDGRFYYCDLLPR
ncbi:MAG: diphthine--ammonia ligase [Candidatus Dadabacteria bacterium]|nr:diphthine--ammonia ligase [Candidatus Dadabacteria bacterium]